MTVTHSNIQGVLRSSTTLDIVQEDRSDLPKESAAQLGAEPSATMLPASAAPNAWLMPIHYYTTLLKTDLICDDKCCCGYLH
ncbi:hypothetical protein TURU_143130 [Turdus rufiventris]|nr:hypothetical protein TURU_143130 [Turdus rufiventris]